MSVDDSDLAAAIHGSHPDTATALVAERVVDGEPLEDVARDLLRAALALSGHELQGATWIHAVLSTLAAVELIPHAGSKVVAPALVGAAGFLAFARPSRHGDGVMQQVDDDALWRSAVAAPGGWGHAILTVGHVVRAPFLGAELRDGARRYLDPPEPGPGQDDDVLADGSMSAADVAAALAGIGSAPLVVRAGSEETRAGLALAACELLVLAPDLRGIHHLTVLREALDAPAEVRPRAMTIAARFIADGWERARIDRRARVRPEFTEGRGEALHADVVKELLRVEPRPGFGHNIKLAAAVRALEGLLPAEVHGALGRAVVATLPTWSRSRRPWLALQAARRAV